jgi:hypothetical protein
VWVVCKRAV